MARIIKAGENPLAILPELVELDPSDVIKTIRTKVQDKRERGIVFLNLLQRLTKQRGDLLRCFRMKYVSGKGFRDLLTGQTVAGWQPPRSTA